MATFFQFKNDKIKNKGLLPPNHRFMGKFDSLNCTFIFVYM